MSVVTDPLLDFEPTIQAPKGKLSVSCVEFGEEDFTHSIILATWPSARPDEDD